jgi:nicotinate-nucleotide adenylyltransferase
MGKLYDESIGIYGGTFNPIHFGHLHLALELMERRQLHGVWFCPARINPLRLDQELVSPAHRLKMVELAIDDIRQFRALDIECRREGPSYMINTLREVAAAHPYQWRLLLGNDAVDTFSRWREPEAIVRLAPPLVGQRNRHVTLEEPSGSAEVVTALQSGLVPMPVMEISSTTVRERLRQGLYCGHLVPPKVLDYIYKHRLY